MQTLVQAYAPAADGHLGPRQYEAASNIGGYPGLRLGASGRYDWAATSGDTCVELGAAGSDYLRQIRSANDAALLDARVAKLMSLAISRARTNTPAPGS